MALKHHPPAHRKHHSIEQMIHDYALLIIRSAPRAPTALGSDPSQPDSPRHGFIAVVRYVWNTTHGFGV
jgi:hypothetical protein